MSFQFCLTRIEYLGADRLIYGILEASFATHQKVIANLPATVTMTLHPGACYQFAVLEPDLKFFDRTTGHASRHQLATLCNRRGEDNAYSPVYNPQVARYRGVSTARTRSPASTIPIRKRRVSLSPTPVYRSHWACMTSCKRS